MDTRDIHIIGARGNVRTADASEDLFAAAGIEVVEVERCPDPGCELCRSTPRASAAAA